MKEHYDFSIFINGPVGWFLLAFCGLVVYNVLKAWQKSDGTIESHKTTVKSDLPVNQIGKHFRRHHEKYGKTVDLEQRKDGFDATTTDILGQEEHYAVRKSKKK